MKLLNFTTSYFAALLFILLTLWAVIFYYQMLDEIYDSMDDGLENQKILVIQESMKKPEILNKGTFKEGNYTIKNVDIEEYRNFRESYRDTLMYMQNERDFEPVRLLESVFRLNRAHYKIKVITSMVEEDDLIEDLLISLIWLYAGLIASILILNNLVLKKVWHPFYILIGQLKNFRIQNNNNIGFQNTSIEEFELLNSSLERFIRKTRDTFIDQKEFIENASHEMQTPLAVAISNLERLMETGNLTEEQMQILENTLIKLESLTRFNKTLLLLSRIKNNQFPAERKISINQVLKEVIKDFYDLTEHKNITVEVEENDQITYSLEPDLAQILLSNLLKNAIVHSGEGSTITVIIERKKIEISNPGEKELEESKIFNRFYKSNSASTGLGLAISKAISELYSIQLIYQFKKNHIFTLNFK